MDVGDKVKLVDVGDCPKEWKLKNGMTGVIVTVYNCNLKVAVVRVDKFALHAPFPLAFSRLEAI